MAKDLASQLDTNDVLAKRLWTAGGPVPVTRDVYLPCARTLAGQLAVSQAVGSVLSRQLASIGGAGSAAMATGAKTKAQLEAEYASIPANTMEGARQREIFRQKFAKELGL